MSHNQYPRSQNRSGRGQWSGGGGQRSRNNQDARPPPSPESFSPAQISAINSDIFQTHIANVGLSIDKIRSPQNGDAKNPYFTKNKSRSSPELNIFEQMLTGNLDKDKCVEYQKFQALPMNQQIQYFLTTQAMSSTDLRFRWQVVFDLLFLLRKEYPNCQVYPFGSLLVGVGDLSSDIDIYIDTNGDHGERLRKDPRGMAAIEEVQKGVEELLKKAICPHTGRPFSSRAFSLGIAVLLVRTEHKATKIRCDLSFRSPVSLNNSKLQLFYMKLNPVVRPFILMLRTWAKFHGISGGTKLKNYALTLLGLTYLMKIGVIPSVHLLQSLVEGDVPEVDGWLYTFCEDVAKIGKHFTPEIGNPDLMEILLGFFEMAATTDFSKVVVCPTLGKFVEKESFLEGKFPEPFGGWIRAQDNLSEMLKMEGQLCVQDVFTIDFNVGGSVKEVILEKFQMAAKITADAIKNNNACSLTDLFIRMEPTMLELEEKVKKEGGAVVEEIYRAVLKTPEMRAKKKYSVLQLSLDYDFKLMYLKEIAVCGILKSNQESERSRVMLELAALWKCFAEKFLQEIFEVGLKLDVVEFQEGQSGSEVKKGWSWNMEMLPEHQFKKYVGRVRFQYPNHVENMKRKMASLTLPTDAIEYKIITVQVTYPFWRNRESKKDKDDDGQGDKGGKPDSGRRGGKVEGGKKNQLINYGNKNPVDVEGQASGVIVEAFRNGLEGDGEKDFKPFGITVLVKLDARKVAIDSDSVTRPTLTIVMENPSDDVADKKDDKELAVKTLSKVLESAFPSFQTYHLSQWINNHTKMA